MGFVITGVIFLTSAVAIVTVYQIIPQHLRENIGHLIDELGGVEQ